MHQDKEERQEEKSNSPVCRSPADEQAPRSPGTRLGEAVRSRRAFPLEISLFFEGLLSWQEKIYD